MMQRVARAGGALVIGLALVAGFLIVEVGHAFGLPVEGASEALTTLAASAVMFYLGTQRRDADSG